MTKSMQYMMVAAAIGFVAVVAAIIVASANNSKADSAESPVVAVAVEVSPVRAAPLSTTVSAVGRIAAMRDVVVSSETAGRVTKVLVKVGSYVKAGQTLVQIDDELKAIGVDQAKAQLQAAETNLRKAENDYQRAEKLFATGDIADVELEGNRLAFHSAEAQYKSATVALRYAQRQLEDTRIKAPISGYIVSKKFDVGEMVSPGKEIANLVDIRKMKVSLSIPEEDIGSIRLKQPVTLRIDSRPDLVFRGEVYTTGGKTETPTGHSYPVEIVVEYKNNDVLKVGMFARVEIELNFVKIALTISKESLASDDPHAAVFVVENNVAHLRPIKVGLRSNDRLQVVEGLREGDLVVSFGQKNLKDGSPVQYKWNQERHMNNERDAK
jgi:membrane fusion protein (multidrug efflux system)